jgi:hypothetical protein
MLDSFRVNWLMIKHLSAQGKPNPRGGLCCFWILNKIRTSIDAFDTLKIFKNKIKLRKLWPFKVETDKN